ncbi:rCG46121, partial [Rattus norvegicus]
MTSQIRQNYSTEV